MQLATQEDEGHQPLIQLVVEGVLQNINFQSPNLRVLGVRFRVSGVRIDRSET